MSRQVHETLNGVNPSSSFRDMRFTKTVLNLLQLWQVFGPWASPYAANGQMTMTSTIIGLENSTELCRDMVSASLAAAQTVTTIPLQPGGLRGEKKMSRSWPRSNLRHSVQLIYLFFVLWQAIYSWDMAIPYLTLKIQGQDHGLQGQNLRSHLMPSIQSIYSFFILWQSNHLFRWYGKF